MSKAWPLVQLGEVLTERREQPASDDLNSGRVKVIEKISFNSGRLQLRVDGSTKTGMILVRPGDLVVSGINAAKGAIAIYDDSSAEPVAATIHYGAYIPNRDRVDIRFLWWMLRSHFFREVLLEYVPGGIKTELKSKRLLPIPVPLPPLAEQRRVVARIEELAAQIQEARGLREQTTKEVEILEERAAEAVFSQLRSSGVPTLTFDDACDRITVGHVSSMRHAYREEGVPFLRSQNVRKNRMDPKGLLYIAPEFHIENPKSALTPGDVVIVRTGFVGVACVIPESLPQANCADLVIVRPGSRLHPQYAAHFLNSPTARNVATSASVGSAQKHYNVGAMKKTTIPLPSPSVQRQIVSKLDDLQLELDATKRLQAESAAELDALLPAILDRAFKGELV